MTDYFKKAMYIGLGMASATKERIDSMVDDMTEQTRMSEEEGRKFADSLKEEAGKARKDLQANIRSVVDDALDRVPTLGRIRHIERRLDALEAAAGIEPPPPPEEAKDSAAETPEPPDLSDPECQAEPQEKPRK